MNRRVGQIVLVAFLVALVGALFLLKKDNAGGAGPKGGGVDQLVIISPHAEQVKTEFDTAFVKWYEKKYGRSVKVTWRDIDAGTAAILAFVEDQFRKNPSSIGIDVLFGGGVDPHIRLKNRQLLQPVKLDDATLKALRQNYFGIEFYDDQYYWYGAALSGFGILYNKALLASRGMPEPKTWEALATPKAFQLVASGDPRRSGANHMCYEIMLQAYGWDKGCEIITRMIANLKALSDGSSGAIHEVELGNCAYALAIDFYAWGKIREIGQGKLGYVIPDSLSVIGPDSISVLKGAPNLEVARRFVEFVMSKDGQMLWMLPAGVPGGPVNKTLARMAIRPDVYTELGDRSIIKVNPFKMKSSLQYDPEKGAKRYDALNQLLGAALLDPRQELEGAWQAVIKRGLKPVEVKALGRPPVSEQELLDLAQDWKTHPENKTRVIAGWESWARKKYKEIAGK